MHKVMDEMNQQKINKDSLSTASSGSKSRGRRADLFIVGVSN